MDTLLEGRRSSLDERYSTGDDVLVEEGWLETKLIEEAES
jgi:hypothetical protein